jgi:mRNA deadenylase 3'-5' endonuclease subunit Ccr4
MNTPLEQAAGSLSLVTYNVQFNKALPEVERIVKKYAPDVICLQEVNLGKRHLYEPLFPGYILAATSNSFYRMGKTFGLATFYRLDRFYQMGSKSIFLPRTYYELLLIYFYDQSELSHILFLKLKNMAVQYKEN